MDLDQKGLNQGVCIHHKANNLQFGFYFILFAYLRDCVLLKYTLDITWLLLLCGLLHEFRIVVGWW